MEAAWSRAFYFPGEQPHDFVDYRVRVDWVAVLCLTEGWSAAWLDDMHKGGGQH